MAVTASAAVPAHSRFSVRWIVNRPVDLCCFIGAAAAGYGMFFLHAGLGVDMLAVWFVWFILLDSPHFFGTYARTYLDREEMRTRRRLLLGSLAWLGVGPLVLVVCFGLWFAGVQNHHLPFLALGVFVALWAYWHVMRQHFGILSLYQRKNGDTAESDRRLDKAALYVGLLAPFVALLVTHPDARDAMGLMPVAAPGGWESWVVGASVASVVLTFAVYAAHQARRLSVGLPLNAPKLLFLSAVVPLHLVVCYHPATMTAPLLGIGAMITIFHDLQYHAIVRYYQRNRYQGEDVDPARYGAATWLGRSFVLYAVCAIAMGCVFGYVSCLTGVRPGCVPALDAYGVTLFGQVTLGHLGLGLVFGLLMHHYFVDQYIWRPSRDATLQDDLRLARQPA